MSSELLARRTVRSFDGTDLAAYVGSARGDAGTVLLIGPLGLGEVAWRHQIAYLAPRFRVVAWDSRGLGASRRPADPAAVRVADHARDAAAVVRDVGVPHCAVVAWGDGAPIALALTHGAPGLASHLVLISPAWSPSFARALGLEPELSIERSLLRALRPAMRSLARFPRSVELGRRFGLVSPTLDRDLFAELAARVTELDPTTLADTERAFARGGDAPLPESLSIPILVVSGSRDRRSSPRAARRLARRLPFGELLVVEDASAWLPLEYPELLGLEIEKFLDRNGFG